MSVLIKGMDMPKDCIECMRIGLWNVFECNVSDVEEGQRLSSCPLVDVIEVYNHTSNAVYVYWEEKDECNY